MRRQLQWIRGAILIIGITLALDVLASLFLIPRWLLWGFASPLDELDKQGRIYDYQVPYSHDFLPNLGPDQVTWGPIPYLFQTDRFALRTGRCAPTDPAEEKEHSVFVIGDSNTEGVGLPYEKTFAGLMACKWRTKGIAVWNLAVPSYSPFIYYRKILAVAEKTGIHPKEIYVFLDISDAQDDAEIYEEKDGHVIHHRIKGNAKADEPIEVAEGVSAPPWRYRVTQFLRHHTMTGALLGILRDRIQRSRSGGEGAMQERGLRRGLWTVNPALMEAYGRKGLQLNEVYLNKIVEICHDWNCRITLTVYPWPDQVAAKDRDSIQVRYWRDWALAHHVRFINGFEPFFRDPTDEVLERYFIPGDIHLNEAGDRLLYEEVSRAVWGD